MKDKLDGKIKDAFDDLEDDVNPALIWSGVNAKMTNIETSKKKKRRFFVWWFFGIGLGMILLSSIFYMNYSTPAIDNKSITNNDIDRQTHFSGTQKAEEQHSEIKEVVSVEDKANVIKVDDLNQLKSSDERQFEEPQEVGESKFVQNRGGLTGIVIYNSSISIQEKEVFSSNDRLYAQDKKQSVSDEQNILNAQLKREMLNIFSLGLKKVNLLTANILRPEITEDVNPHVYIDRSSKDSRLFNAIELYSSISLGNKSVSSSNLKYATSRNESEMLLEQLGLGLRIQIIKLQGFTFLAGAKYSRLTDRWISDLEYVEDMPLTYIEYKTEFPDGSIEDHFTTDTLEHNINRYIQQYNSEHMLSFPLELRYGAQVNNWTFAIGVGLDVNYLFASEHKVLGLNGLPVIETKESKWLSPSISMGLHTSYALSSSWNITANLNYRRLSINSESIVPDFNSKYNLFGMELGLSRRIGW